MYPLGNQFIIDYTKAIANPKNIIKGQTFRITVLTERLLRLEYSRTGNFIDAPTQFAYRRDFKQPLFTVRQDNKFLQLTTKYFSLEYTKEASFDGGKLDPMKNLKIKLQNQDKTWYYHHPEARNFYGINLAVDTKKAPDKVQKALYSIDGFASFDDSNHLVFQPDGTLTPRLDGDIDIYVFLYGKDFHLALKDYFYLTGEPPLLPRYALGTWWSRNKSYTQNEVLEVIEDFKQSDIPLTVFLFDKDWHVRQIGEEKLDTGYTFNQNLLPNPVELFQKLHEENIKIGLNINPKQGIYPHEAFYAQACSYLGITGNKIIMFDPLNPKFLDIYMKVFLHPLENIGVDFFWNDYDVENYQYLWLLNHYQYLDSGRNPNKRSMLLARNGLIASHRYPVLYSGKTEVSWEMLRKIPFYNMNASNGGVSWWSHDIGGNHGGIEESELYIRYVELGVFSPIVRFNAARGVYYKKEPWLWDIKTKTIVSKYLNLRSRLIPYLYTEAYNYYKDGKPLIEPFYYKNEWVYDDVVYRNQYFFGSQLLIAPILDRKDSVMNRTIQKFYIPDGTWYDFKTGKKFPGNKKYVSFYQEEDYPIFAKSGAIIPLAGVESSKSYENPKELEIHIFPGQNNSYVLFEDDGISGKYKDGFFLKTLIDYNYLKNNYTVIIRSLEGKSGILAPTRDYKIRFRNTKFSNQVSAYFNDQICEISTYIEENDFVVDIKNIPTIGQLTVNCKGSDIEVSAVRLINEDINNILLDLKINTILKEKIAEVLFNNTEIKKKRISIRKLRTNGLSREHMKLFLKLLEYIEQI